MESHIFDRKSKFLLAAALIVLLLTCYFCWEILYQERAILGILKMSRIEGVKKQIAPGSLHLEEIAENWFDKKQSDNILLSNSETNTTHWISSEKLIQTIRIVKPTKISR
jgi:L-serine deaminase